LFLPVFEPMTNLPVEQSLYWPCYPSPPYTI
jgi:hypothetical protein